MAMEGTEPLADADRLPFDPETVTIDDQDVFDLLEPPMQEWWLREFGEYVPGNEGFFTPPQREAIPKIHGRENVLVCAPTGSGKCVKPDTPLLIEEEGSIEALRAEELLDRRGRKIADVDSDGELYDSRLSAVSLNDGELERCRSYVYTEPYSGDLHRIETVYGRTVEVTPDHPLLVETADGPEWKPAADVDEGDRIGVPKRMDLSENRTELDVEGAVRALEERFPIVLTADDYRRIAAALDTAETTDDLGETELREALAASELPMDCVSERLSIGLSTVHGQITKETSYKSAELLELLREELVPVGENEVLVKKDNGKTSRFRYPTELDTDLALLSSFVLAEGLVADYDKAGFLVISQTRRHDLLDDAFRIVREKFGVEFRQKNEQDYLIEDSAFSLFFAELMEIDLGRGRGVRLPGWCLNAPVTVKRAFVSTFLSLEAEIRPDEIRLVQANEMKIEQLSYLLLSFGIFPARSTGTRISTSAARNTREQVEREYYELTIRGKENLSTLLSTLDVRHENAEVLEAYASSKRSGTLENKYAFDYRDVRSLSTYFEDDQAFQEVLGNVYEAVRRTGYITERALDRLVDVLSALPDTGPARAVSERIEEIRGRNVAWLEVTSTQSVEYNGRIIDLTVPNTHNFVGGRGGMYLHNTLASFCSIINELFARERSDEGLENSVYCLYVSPLKSLANDIHRNLDRPLSGIADILEDHGESTEIRHAIRHGDTPSADRQRMLEETPHILNTTPETLAILLNSPKFREKLRTVEYVVVDEIHSLAENKRGTHLSVSLERLENLAERSPTRIGCSATVEPLDTMAEFLVGREGDDPDDLAPRDCEIVDTRFVREFDIELGCPTGDLINTSAEVVQKRFYDRLNGLISEHTNTLVFTNTRSGAERVLQNLRERFSYDETDSGCHHGSLSRESRQRVEEGLKAGDLDVVTTSTSLELGIDMPHVDLVVQVGSPKSVAALLQRVGRAGHRLGRTVTGRVIALDRDELIECAVMLRKAEEGFVDRVFVPENPADVAAQHVYGMAISGVRPEREVKATLKRAYPYREFSEEGWESLLRYLTADYEGLEERNVYAKVWRDTNDPPEGQHHYAEYEVGEPLIGKRGRLARVIYMTNIGTIPDSFTCTVLTRGENERVGDLDESYLDTLDPGDVFVLGGQHFEFRYRRGSKVYVDRTSARPTVPSWFSERLPLSYDLGREILGFKRELIERYETGGPPAVRRWLRDFPIDDNSVRAITRMFDEQVRYAGIESVSTDRRLAIEEEHDRDEYKRRYYVRSNYGRRFNDGFSRLLAYQCARTANANVNVAVADNGFALSMPLNRKVDLPGLIEEIDPDEVRGLVRESLEGTDLLQRYFRINATRSLMILKRYKGYEKSASQQQVSSEMLLGLAGDLEGFAVLEETYREILEDKLAVGAIEDVLGRIRDGRISLERERVDSPSPLSFGLATLSASDVVLAEDESAVLKEFHDRVLETIGEDAAVLDG